MDMVLIRKVYEVDWLFFEVWLDSLNLYVEMKDKFSVVLFIFECLLVGQEMVEILCQFNMDDVMFQVVLVFFYCEQYVLSEDDIYEEFGGEICDLVVGVCRMDVIKFLYVCKVNGFGFVEKLDEQYIDSICCMLFVMVEDVCVVVIKMVECICVL